MKFLPATLPAGGGGWFNGGPSGTGAPRLTGPTPARWSISSIGALECYNANCLR